MLFISIEQNILVVRAFVAAFDFEDRDPIWDIIRKYGIASDEIRQAILAWAYTIVKQDERDEVFEALNEGFGSFRRRMVNVDEQELRKIYGIP